MSGLRLVGQSNNEIANPVVALPIRGREFSLVHLFCDAALYCSSVAVTVLL